MAMLLYGLEAQDVSQAQPWETTEYRRNSRKVASTISKRVQGSKWYKDGGVWGN